MSGKEAKRRPIATRLLINIYDYLHDGDFIEYSKKLSIDERQDVVYHFFSRLDRFMAKMVSSGMNIPPMLLFLKMMSPR